MLSPNLTRVDGVLSKMDSIKKFAEAVGVKEIDDGALVEKVIRLRLPLPEETVKVVLSLPSKQLKEVPLDKSPEDFLKSFVSFWHVNNESLRIIYKQIIDSSLVMREAFDNVKNQIINNTANMWRRELKSSSDERKQRLEKEIQENTELFLKL
jgi:hypothetical protein